MVPERCGVRCHDADRAAASRYGGAAGDTAPDLSHSSQEDSLHLEVKLGEEWRPVYSIDEVDFHPVDFEAANWFVSTNPGSDFVKSLILARPTADRRQILNNTTLSIRDPDGSVRRRTIADPGELRATITDMFGIRLPDNRTVDRALEGLFHNGSGS